MSVTKSSLPVLSFQKLAKFYSATAFSSILIGLSAQGIWGIRPALVPLFEDREIAYGAFFIGIASSIFVSFRVSSWLIKGNAADVKKS